MNPHQYMGWRVRAIAAMCSLVAAGAAHAGTVTVQGLAAGSNSCTYASVTGTGDTLTFVCQGGTLPAISCTASASPQSLPSSGGTSTLTAACTGSANYTYSWAPASLIASGQTAASATTANLTQSQLFTVSVGSDGGQTSASVNVSVASVNPPPPPPPPTDDVTLCQNTANFPAGYRTLFTNTVNSGRIDNYAYSWNQFSDAAGNFPVVSIKLSYPSELSAGSAGRIAVFENGTYLTQKWVSVSTRPCDYALPTDAVAGTALTVLKGTTSPNIYYFVSSTPVAGFATLAPGQAYYVNVASFKSPSGGVRGGGDGVLPEPTSCPANTKCGFSVEFNPPN